MSRRKPTAKAEFVMFDVLYEDGTLTSNRRVPSEALQTYEGDAPAKGVIEAQDQEIEERSGRSRGPIKSISRAGKR